MEKNRKESLNENQKGEVDAICAMLDDEAERLARRKEAERRMYQDPRIYEDRVMWEKTRKRVQRQAKLMLANFGDQIRALLNMKAHETEVRDKRSILDNKKRLIEIE